MGLAYFVKQCPHKDVQNTPQPCHQSTKLRIMSISIKTKVVVKFGSSEMMYVVFMVKTLWDWYTLLTKVKQGHTVTHLNHVFSQQIIMTISIKTKVVVKFGSSKMMYVDMRVSKLWNVYTLPNM